MSARFCHERDEAHEFDVVRGRVNAARHCTKCPMISLDWDDVSTCIHCGRVIVNHPEDGWIDPEADGDDRIWRETCDSHDTRIADHEPTEPEDE